MNDFDLQEQTHRKKAKAMEPANEYITDTKVNIELFTAVLNDLDSEIQDWASYVMDEIYDKDDLAQDVLQKAKEKVKQVLIDAINEYRNALTPVRVVLSKPAELNHMGSVIKEAQLLMCWRDERVTNSWELKSRWKNHLVTRDYERRMK